MKQKRQKLTKVLKCILSCYNLAGHKFHNVSLDVPCESFYNATN